MRAAPGERSGMPVKRSLPHGRCGPQGARRPKPEMVSISNGPCPVSGRGPLRLLTKPDGWTASLARAVFGNMPLMLLQNWPYASDVSFNVHVPPNAAARLTGRSHAAYFVNRLNGPCPVSGHGPLRAVVGRAVRPIIQPRARRTESSCRRQPGTARADDRRRSS